MDARCAFRSVVISGLPLLIALSGCATFDVFGPKPTPAQKADPEPPQVVKGEAASKPSTDGPEMDVVQHWVSQMAKAEPGTAKPRPRATPIPKKSNESPEITTVASKTPIIETPDEPELTTPETTAANVPITAGNSNEPLPPAAPPKLRSVEVRPVGAPGSNSPAAPRPSPRASGASVTANMPISSQSDDVSIRDLLERWLAQPGGESFREQLDRRVLAVLNDDVAGARKPLEAVSADQQRVANQFIELLMAMREAHGGDPSGEIARILPHAAELHEAMAPLADLTIPVLVLCRAVRGFGQFDALSSTTLPAGRINEFVVYAEVSNFVSRKGEDSQFEAQFSMQTQVFSKAGDVVVEYKDDAIVDRCRTQRHDCFIPRLVSLPATLSPGEYVVKVTIADRIGRKLSEARQTLSLAVRT